MRVLGQIETALHALHGWAGWTDQDRVMITDMARQVRHLAQRYAVRRAEFLKAQRARSRE